MVRLFIVKSGSGYFIKFIRDQPYCVSDPLLATRLDLGKANKTIRKLNNLGFGTELVKLKFSQRSLAIINIK